MIISHDLTEQQYLEIEKFRNAKYRLNREFLIDLHNRNLKYRIDKLIPEKYLKDDIDYYFIIDNIISSWTNLLREWFKITIRKDITTHLYWARVKRHPKLIKIGITYNIEDRSNFLNNRYYDYHIIKKFPNRFSCAYVEYKIRTLFCKANSELIELDQLNDVIDYANNVKANKQELILLGWKF